MKDVVSGRMLEEHTSVRTLIPTQRVTVSEEPPAHGCAVSAKPACGIEGAQNRRQTNKKEN